MLADENGRLAVLFGEPERARRVEDHARLALVAVAVPGVADLYVQEALWTAWDILRGASANVNCGWVGGWVAGGAIS